MKKISVLSLLLFALLFAGCAAPAESKDFTLSEQGYILDGLPYGSTVEETEKALGSRLIDTGGTPVDTEQTFDSYYTDTVKFRGTNGYFDAQFAEDGLYSFTFNVQGEEADMEALYTKACAHYEELFGAPTDSDSTSSTLEAYDLTYKIDKYIWIDSATDTRLLITLTKTEGRPTTYQIAVIDPPLSA